MKSNQLELGHQYNNLLNSEMVFKKKSLLKLYEDFYTLLSSPLKEMPESIKGIEIGSATGMGRKYLKGAMITDIVPGAGIDMVVDATNIPFPNHSLDYIALLNVLHHIHAPELFFSEAERCLKPGGKILLIDPHHGPLNKFIYRNFHYENYDEKISTWGFESGHPQIDANAAISYIVFKRDYALFREKYPSLHLKQYVPCFALSYWLIGGLKRWTFVPGFMYGVLRVIDQLLATIFPSLSSFVFVEIEKESLGINS